jgi:hypothetical protein
MPRVSGFQTDTNEVHRHIEGFNHHEPGFSLTVGMSQDKSRKGLITETEQEKIFGVVSTLMSVAIFE